MSFTGSAIVDSALAYALMASSNVSGDRQLRFLNDVLRECGQGYDSSFSLSTVSSPALTNGTQEYPILSGVTGVSDPLDIRIVEFRTSSTGQWSEIERIDESEAGAYDQDTGQPWAWYEVWRAGVYTVGLVPKPNAAFAAAGVSVRFKYKYRPSGLAAIGDTIYLPDELQDFIAYKLAAKFAMLDGEDGLARSQVMLAMAEREKNKTSPNRLKKALASYNPNPEVMGGPGGIGGGTVRRYIS